MIKFLQKLGHDTRGATAVEYGLILALVFLTIIGSVTAFGEQTITMWNNVAAKVAAASPN